MKNSYHITSLNFMFFWYISYVNFIINSIKNSIKNKSNYGIFLFLLVWFAYQLLQLKHLKFNKDKSELITSGPTLIDNLTLVIWNFFSKICGSLTLVLTTEAIMFIITIIMLSKKYITTINWGQNQRHTQIMVIIIIIIFSVTIIIWL